MFCKKCGIENDDKAANCRSCSEPLVLPEVSVPVGSAALAVEYAGFWKRAIAATIDSVILFVVGTVVGIFIIMITGSSEGLQIINNLLGAIIGWLYFALQESSPKQATIGKATIGIIVTDSSGKRLSFYRASGRHFGKLVSTITLGFGFLMASFTKRKQALHDIMFDCLVVVKQ